MMDVTKYLEATWQHTKHIVNNYHWELSGMDL